jgi:hypothetical protein
VASINHYRVAAFFLAFNYTVIDMTGSSGDKKGDAAVVVEVTFM